MMGFFFGLGNVICRVSLLLGAFKSFQTLPSLTRQARDHTWFVEHVTTVRNDSRQN